MRFQGGGRRDTTRPNSTPSRSVKVSFGHSSRERIKGRLYRNRDQTIRDEELVLPVQYQAPIKVSSGFNGDHSFQNRFRCPLYQLPYVFDICPFQPLGIFNGRIYRAIELLRPFDVRGIVVRMGDDNGIDSA